MKLNAENIKTAYETFHVNVFMASKFCLKNFLSIILFKRQ